MTQESDVFAKKGQKVTCEAGHPICEVAVDLKFGETTSVDQFTNWKITPPKMGDLYAPCSCGQWYVRTLPRATDDDQITTQAFIDGKWVP